MKINFNVKSAKAWTALGSAVIMAFISKPQSKATKNY